MDEETRRNQSYWKKRTGMEKCLLVSHLLAIIIIISLVVVIFTVRLAAVSSYEGYDISNNESANDRGVCKTIGCVKAATSVLESIDPSVEPCDDFYKFACGNYINNAIIPSDEFQASIFNDVKDLIKQQLKAGLEEPVKDSESNSIQKVKNYYQACMNTKKIEDSGLETIKDLVKQAGGWPVLEGTDWNQEDFDWKKLMHKFRKLGFKSNIFVAVVPINDLKNSTIRRIALNEPELGSTRQYLVEGLENKNVVAYFKLMVDIATDFGCDRAMAERELKESLKFEIELANCTMTDEEKRDFTRILVMSINEVQQNYSGIPWLEFIKRLLPREMSVDGNETLILTSPKYLLSMINLLNQTPKRVQANFAMWRAIQNELIYLNENVRRRWAEYSNVTMGITDFGIRWRQCIDVVMDRLPELASAVYIRKYFQNDAKSNAVEMIKYIKESFINILKSLDWMDNVTRRNALAKVAAVVSHIGYPDELLDNKKLEQYFKTLEVYPDQYLKSGLNIEIHDWDFIFRRLRQPVNKTDWIDHAQVAKTNAIYNSQENSINFPAGILQSAFFSKDRPRYMNFAAIGSIIGHELTHGFDDTGAQFDKDGNFVDWWDPKTKELFRQKAECIINQYGNYTVPGTDMHLDGNKTVGENIADNGGIKEAYLAYKEWVKNNGPETKLPGLDFSPNQLFWISGAMTWCTRYKPESISWLIAEDIHSLFEFRVLGPYSNLEYFARDFNCPNGSRMNPIHKCVVW